MGVAVKAATPVTKYVLSTDFFPELDGLPLPLPPAPVGMCWTTIKEKGKKNRFCLFYRE